MEGKNPTAAHTEELERLQQENEQLKAQLEGRRTEMDRLISKKMRSGLTREQAIKAIENQKRFDGILKKQYPDGVVGSMQRLAAKS